MGRQGPLWAIQVNVGEWAWFGLCKFVSLFELMFRYERMWGDGVRSDEREERTEISLWVEK